MKNNFILLGLIGFSFIHAQVGINTPDPKATLEVVAKNTTATSVDGIIAPKIDRLRAFNMSGVPDGTLIYIDNFSTGSATGQTVNVTSAGYYYFEGTTWQKVNTSSVADTNIYNSDGIITASGARNVTMGTNTLNWNSSGATANTMNINANSLTTANALNISTSALTTGSAVNVTSANSTTNTNGIIKVVNNSPSGAGTFATLQANNTTGSGINILNNGNVGVGTVSPAAKLSVNGNVIIGSVTSTNGATGFSSLVRDNTTGEVKVSSSSTGNTFPINYITYTLSNVNGDWVENYDTKISTGDYTVVVVGSKFSDTSTTGTGSLRANYVSGFGTSALYNYFATNVYAYQSGGTWRLSADYAGGNSANGNGTWTFYCLVINNILVKTLGGVTQNLGGAQTGAATTGPTGL